MTAQIKFEGLQEYHIETHSEKWFQFRTVGVPEYEGGLGASEVGKICGHDEYSPCPGELFHHKVGTYFPEQWDNERMLHGRISEPLIIDFTQLYDGTIDSIVNNYEKFIALGKPDSMIKRKIHRVRSYLVNPQYPWLFISLDAVVDKGQVSLRTGEIMDCYIPLEIKTIGEMQAKQWDAGFPRKYVYQINLQMLVLGVRQGEVAILKDGKYYDHHTFDRSDVICNEILEKTKYFWYNRVLPAREYFKAYKDALQLGNKALADKAMARINSYEPPPTGTEEDYKWKKRRVVEAAEAGETEKAAGDPLDFILARKYVGIREVEKQLKKKQNLVRSEILMSMHEKKTKFISFEEDGKVSISSDGKLLVKVDIDYEQEAKKIVDGFDLNRFE